MRRAPRHVVVVGDGRRACVERLDTPAPRAPAVSPRRDAPRHSDYPRRGRGVLTAEYPRRGICRHDPSTEYIRVAARLGSPPPRAPAETERPRRGRGRDPSTDYSGPSRGVAAILPRTIQAPSAASPRLVHGLFRPQPRRRRDSSTDYSGPSRGVAATRPPRTIQVPASASPRPVHGLSRSQPRRRRDSSTDYPAAAPPRPRLRTIQRAKTSARPPVRFPVQFDGRPPDGRVARGAGGRPRDARRAPRLGRALRAPELAVDFGTLFVDRALAFLAHATSLLERAARHVSRRLPRRDLPMARAARLGRAVPPPAPRRRRVRPPRLRRRGRRPGPAPGEVRRRAAPEARARRALGDLRGETLVERTRERYCRGGERATADGAHARFDLSTGRATPRPRRAARDETASLEGAGEDTASLQGAGSDAGTRVDVEHVLELAFL